MRKKKNMHIALTFALLAISVCSLLIIHIKTNRALPILEYNKQKIARLQNYTEADADEIVNIFRQCEQLGSNYETSFFSSRIAFVTEIEHKTTADNGTPITLTYCRMIMEDGQCYDVCYGHSMLKNSRGKAWAVYRGPWEDNDLILGIII